MSDVTQILSQIEQGDAGAAERLLPMLYEELRKLAAHRMARESVDHTLDATALVHEAYIRLVDVKKAQHWDSRGHFFAAAAEAMRRILIEQARRKRGPTAGGRHHRVGWSGVEPDIGGPNLDLLVLNEALEKLEATDARAAKLIKLRFFAGLTNDEAAKVLGVSSSTAKSEWAYARSWLRAEMAEGSST